MALLGLMLTVSAAPIASAAVIVIHNGPRDAPPTAVEERPGRSRRGYIWVGGHHRWRRNHYYWNHGHYARERRGYEYAPGHWDHHEDHYDWYDGEWHPHR